MDDLTALINSCYAYSDMWDNTINLFKANWGDNPPVVLLSDKSDSTFDKKFNFIKTYPGEMSKRIIHAFKDIKTKYVFLTFDDYYLIDKVNIKLLNEVVEFMEQNDISYCGTKFNIKKGKRRKYRDIKYIESKLAVPYEVNLYPSIWNREDLITCLTEDKNIWQTEASLTKKLKNQNKKAIILRNKNVFPFLDVIRKGKYIRKAKKYIVKNNLVLSDRPVRTRKEAISNTLSLYASLVLPHFVKRFLKSIGRKRGGKYFSDEIE